MTIAINVSPFIKYKGGSEFFQAYFLKIALSKPAHQFIFITASQNDEQFENSKNIIRVISSPRANNPLMWKIWLDYTLPRIARKYNAEIIIHMGGICSLRTKIRQCLFISNLSFLNSPQFFSKKELFFLKKKTPAFLKKATAIVTTSDFLTEEIEQHYSIGLNKIKRTQLVADDYYKPLDWKEIESIKELYAEEKEYFLFSGEIHPANNLVNLLKAFSFFKKRQKSNMQLIITTSSVSEKDPFIENLKLYKYRKEVKILFDMPELDLAKITASAYAFVYPTTNETITLLPLQAMQCEVPVITTLSGSVNEICGDAVIYTAPENFEDIADKMMLVFKDETYRAEIIKKAKLRLQKIKTSGTANEWWKTLIEPNGDG